ncbi:ATP synthase F0 subunit B [Streptomyces sp. NPDC006967]|uniref:ATP synthase F0 subunit B n=1 Tax=unclassified Streptomyces TaxID=2593676 RepID=UPI0033E387CA
MGARKPTANRNTRKTTMPRRQAKAAAPPPKPEARDDGEALAEDLRDRAADVIDGARWTGAQEAAVLIQAAEVQVQQIRRAAAADAKRVLVEAADEVGERLRRAEGDADTIRAGARGDAQTILEQARRDAAAATEEVMADAEEQAKGLLADAEKQVSVVLAEAEDRANALVDLRRTSAEAAYRKALDDAARIVGEAQDQAVEIRTARAALDSELELARRSARLDLDEELNARRAEIGAELTQYRAEVDAARVEIETRFRQLGEQHERERQAQRARLASEFEELRREAERDARAAAGGVRKEADAKLAEANRELAAAREARRVAEKRAASLKRTRNRAEVVKQGSVWVALAAVIVLTASGEWAFARMVGLGDTPFGDMGWALPLGLDVYAVTAFRMKRDVPYALGLMAATNITYHVADMTGHGVTVVDGKQHPSIGLIVVAVLVVVAIVWRVHRLLEDDHEEKETAPAEPAADTTDPSAGRGEPDRTAIPKPDRTADPNPGRTEPTRTARTADRTDADRTARTAKTRTARTPAPRTSGRTAAVRTDAEAVQILRGLDRDGDYVTVNAARTAVGCNRDRAVRLLDEAGLLSPADREKHLAAR